jgi:putative hydrolase of the HAD superfamily
VAAAVRALLLDAVGTVIRSREPVATVYARVAESYRIQVDRQALESKLAVRLARFAPPSLDGVAPDEIPHLEREGWRGVIREVLGRDAAEGACFDTLFTLYGSADPWQVVPGVPEALDRVRASGVRVAVVSNMDTRLTTVLRELGLASKLNAIVLPSNCGVAKPDPRIFHTALEHLEVSPEAALYIGDREVDCVDAARAAGVRALRYDPSAGRQAPNVLATWGELTDQLERMGEAGSADR